MAPCTATVVINKGGFMRACIFTLLLCIFCLNAFADEAWQPVSGIGEPDIKEVAVGGGIIYASSGKSVYRTEDNGETWNAVFSVRGDGSIINFIAVSRQGVFVCTQDGLFKSDDGETGWKRVFKGVGVEENDVLHIAFSEKDVVYLGTRGGLFTSEDKGLTWQKDPGEAGGLSIKWITFLGGDVFIAAERGVYEGLDGRWKRVFVVSTQDTQYDADSADEAAVAIKPVNSIFVKDGQIFLATDSGVFVSEDRGGDWKRFTSGGLLSQRIKRLLFKGNLYALTENRGVFVFDEQDKTWKALYRGMSSIKPRSIAIDGNGIIWVATDKGLYRSRVCSSLIAEMQGIPVTNSEDAVKDILRIFEGEPSIREVQDAAVRYAEVHPDKIKDWRDAAKRKALLPKISVGLDRYVTGLYHWDAGQNPDVLQKGEDAVSWDITMTWDLGELIWNEDQTSIDTRSRLMVQLRDDVLDEITRTYFERRRLRSDIHLSPPSDPRQGIEKELRVQELTADIDALTGGYFSEEINRNF